MSEELYSVDFAAQRLKLHPKTVLRFIREGRLHASRVGKSYRILRSDLEAFAGLPKTADVTPADAWVTAIVDIPGVGKQLAQEWAKRIPSALQSRANPASSRLRADVVYEPERSHLKIVVVGDAADTLTVLQLIRVWLEQPAT